MAASTDTSHTQDGARVRNALCLYIRKCCAWPAPPLAVSDGNHFADRKLLVSFLDCILSFFFALLSLVILSLLFLQLHENGREFIIGSFGAMAVLLFHCIETPVAQPFNLIMGNVISAIIGVAIRKLIPSSLDIVSAPLAVATAVSVMGYTHTSHPPGGATALIAVIGGENIHQLGFWYVLHPVFSSGVIVLLVCAVLLNNISSARQYPLYWGYQTMVFTKPSTHTTIKQ